MSSSIRMRSAALTAAATALAGCFVIGLGPIAAHAAPIPDLLGPGVNTDYGGQVLTLSNGNYVVVDKYFDFGSEDVGSVSLYSSNNHKITTVIGATAGDQIGSDGVFEVGAGDFVILSGSWHDANGAAVGAATWVDGTTGLAGAVGAGNSLIGTTPGDFAGSGVTALTNGDFVISNPNWGGSDLGAVTWASGFGALTGRISATNSLVGTMPDDMVGSGGVTALPNGNYVVSSPQWDATASDAGAVTWATGTAATHVAVSTTNSLTGSTPGDMVGSGGVTALTNGNYVVSSPNWDGVVASDPLVNNGAATWADGSKVTSAAVAPGNSMIGGSSFDMVASGGVAALSNGNYAVSSPMWNDAPFFNAGAVTWANGTASTAIVVSDLNSLVGGASIANVGAGGITPLSDGNYVVSSPFWSGNGRFENGAVTWASGTASTNAVVAAANSIIGQRDSDMIGSAGVAALVGNGNYVISSPLWDDGGSLVDVGAVTWATGGAMTSAIVSNANSIVGTTTFDPIGLRAADQVGSSGVTALTDGNYVVSSPFWNGGSNNEGAVTWLNGTLATGGTVTESNSLHGTSTDDNVGGGSMKAVAGGNYVVSSPQWANGSGEVNADAGAATFGPALGINGAVDSNNSVIGTPGATLGQVLSASPLLTADNSINIATTQSRVLRLDALTDFQPPTIVQDDIKVAAATPQSVTFAPIASDNIGVASVLCAPASGSSFPLGATTVSCTATDTATPIANSATKTFTVTVVPADTTPPQLTVPVSVSASTSPGASTQGVKFTVTATDDQGIQTAGCDPASGSLFPVGVTTVTCTATDTSGQTTSDTFTVTVGDLEAPVLVGMPSDIVTGAAPGAVTKVVTFTLPTATDNVAVAGVTCDRASGSTFPLGVTTVTCTATDTANPPNTSSQSFTVTVSDQEPPVFGAAGNIFAVAAPGTTSKAVTFTKPTATDNQGVQSVVCDKSSGSSFPVGVTTVSCTATDVAGLTATTSFTVTVTAAGADYVALSPARLADSRSIGATVDGLFAGDGSHDAGTTVQLTVTGRGGVAADASAVALNVTAVDATAAGFVTVFPCGSDQPTASNLNFTAGSITPNAVVAKVGAAGKVCIFVSASTHVVVDVNGYFPPTSSLHSLNPARVLETRSAMPTIDGQQQGVGIRTAGSTISVPITGRATIPADATGAVLNLTVTEAEGAGFATVYPCGSPLPAASSINFVAGATVANMVVSKIGDGGAVCVFTSERTHVVVDVAGYFPATTTYNSLLPARLMETRSGMSTIDDKFAGAGMREAGEVTELEVTGRGGVPGGSATVVLNVTVTEPSRAGFVTVYPCGITTPLASNLNFEAGSTVANAVIAKVGVDGKVCLFSSNPGQLVVDVNGVFPA